MADNADLANIFNDDDAGAGRANSITSSDLDPFLLQGDEQTWAVEDWNWDPFNMFAAPKEVPNVACCQALKRRKVADHTATSAAPQQQQMQQQQMQQQQMQQQQQACQPCHGAGGSRAGPPAAPAAACCSMAPGVQQLPNTVSAQQLAGPLQVALHSLMPQRVVETCGTSNLCHGSGMVGPPPPMPVAAPMTATGPQAGGMGFGMGGNMGMGWGGMMDMSTAAGAAAAAAAAAASFFPNMGNMGGGGRGPLAAMGWGGQSMALQMPGMALPAFPNGHAQCAPAMPMPAPAFQAHNSGIFNQQASMAMPPSAVPSPALGCSGDTTSLQGSADNGGAKPPCCSGNQRGHGPTCSGGRQQADSSNKAPAPQPNKQQSAHNAGGRGGGAAAAAAGDLSDFAMSDSEDDDEVARRPSAAGNRGGNNAAAHAALYANLGDIVALQDVADDSGAMVCQVPGCGKDLTNLKEYHQRYRICDVHIKLQQVLKDGRLQRFCQQCGRFHDLTAFDGNRKSCRDQLSKHNARRRRRAQAEQAKGRAAAHEAATAAAGAMTAAAVGSVTGVPGFEGGDVGKLLSTLMSNPTQLHALRLLLGVPTHPALPVATPAGGLGMGALGGADAGNDAAPDQARTYSLARDILGGRHEFTPAFESEHRMIRLSMKLFNKTPADLPADLRNQVSSWLASAPLAMEACIRPGCVFLTVHMLVDQVAAAQAEAPGALTSFAQHLLTRTGCPFWHSGMYTAQLGANMLLVRDGKLAGDVAVGGQTGVAAAPQRPNGGDGRFPTVRRLGPYAAVAGQPTVLKLHGQNLDAPGCSVVLRWGNKHLKAHLQALSAHRAIVRLPPLPNLSGPVWVEVARGAYLSPAKQLLVASNEELVEEINKLDVRTGTLHPDTVELLLQDMALVLQHIAAQPGVAAQLPHAAIALKARRLLAMACDMGWAAVASAVLPLACARCSCASEMVAAIHAASMTSDAAATANGDGDARGLTLLHRAVRSGSVPLLAGMLAWGDTHGYRWRVDAEGPAGITPLHLSAMLDDARIGLLLLDHCGWPAAFTHLRTDGGVTPFHLAFQMGHYQVDNLMAALGGLHQVVDPASAANNAAGAAAAGPANRRSRCGNHAAVGCKPDPDAEDVKPDMGALAGGKGHGKGGHGGGGNGACSEVDPCENCHCTLPPLLLSIMASCNDCGRRRMCMDAEANDATQRCSDCACGGARPTARSDTGEVCCSRLHSTIFSITALCQGCHANRVLAVA